MSDEEKEQAENVLERVCKYRAFRFLEYSHCEGEIYCQKPPRNYGEEPRCEFQCLLGGNQNE